MHRTRLSLVALLLLLLTRTPSAAQEFVYPGEGTGEVGRAVSFDELNALLETKLERVRKAVGSSAIPQALLAAGALDPTRLTTAEAALLGQLPPSVNILLLGLDRRIDWAACHADAIHLFSIDTASGAIRITTVPRGTRAFAIPGHPGAYAAEAYFYGGRDLMRDLVGRFLGAPVDYVVEVDFAAAMRGLELLGYKGQTTLRFLRHRKSYGPGDNQRCHNQALFMKEQVPRVLPFLRRAGGELLLRTAYALVWTDLPYPTLKRIALRLLQTGLDADPDRVTLAMKPEYKGGLLDGEIPDADAVDAKVADQYSKIGGERDHTPEFSMFGYLQGLATELKPSAEADAAGTVTRLEPVFERKLWNQIDEFAVRRHVHRELADIYARALAAAGRPARADRVREEAAAAYDLRDVWQIPEGTGEVSVATDEVESAEPVPVGTAGIGIRGPSISAPEEDTPEAVDVDPAPPAPGVRTGHE